MSTFDSLTFDSLTFDVPSTTPTPTPSTGNSIPVTTADTVIADTIEVTA